MVGPGRFELPSYGLGVRLIFPKVFVFNSFYLVTALLFWAWPGAELATQFATDTFGSQWQNHCSLVYSDFRRPGKTTQIWCYARSEAGNCAGLPQKHALSRRSCSIQLRSCDITALSNERN
jgi:hypothetical protein